MAKQAMTRVSGYYNSAKWPIQIVFPKLNISLTLKPGDYTLGRDGRKIDDPCFEAFAKSGQLSRELLDVPVPINGLPAVPSRCP